MGGSDPAFMKQARSAYMVGFDLTLDCRSGCGLAEPSQTRKDSTLSCRTELAAPGASLRLDKKQSERLGA
jgi:hypothetical protein